MVYDACGVKQSATAEETLEEPEEEEEPAKKRPKKKMPAENKESAEKTLRVAGPPDRTESRPRGSGRRL